MYTWTLGRRSSDGFIEARKEEGQLSEDGVGHGSLGKHYGHNLVFYQSMTVHSLISELATLHLHLAILHPFLKFAPQWIVISPRPDFGSSRADFKGNGGMLTNSDHI